MGGTLRIGDDSARPLMPHASYLMPCPHAVLPMHQIRFVHVDRLSMVEERDEDGEPDGCFRRRDRHHEKDKDESVKLVELTSVREERQIDGVHHELDGHEDGDAVLARENAADADRKENRAEDQKPLRRNHGCTSGRAAARPLNSSAPTIAASNRIDTISNGKTYDSNNATPIARASVWNGPFGSAVKTAYLIT